MDRQAAIDRLWELTAATEDPILEITDATDIIDRSRVSDLAGNAPTNTSATADSWQASTQVLPGTVMVSGDRYWRCVVGGTTDATEPAWPDLAGRPVSHSTTVDDGSVVWADNGTEWAPTWNMDRAAMLAWERKAAKATGRYTFTTDGQRFERAQIAAACHAQADRYRRRLATSTG